MIRILVAAALIPAFLLGMNHPGVSAQAPVHARIAHPSGKVFIFLNQARTDAASAGARADVTGYLRQSGASQIKSLWLIHAVAARVSPAQSAYLASNPDVRAIIPDQPIFLPSGAAPRPVPLGHVRHRPHNVCQNTAPLLEPEALQLTNDAFSDPSTPQAQSLATGAGVKVAFLAGSIDVNNPDLKRAGGQNVITDYEDFTGEGTVTNSSSGEAFGDASSIAAQGNQTYNLSSYANSHLPQASGCATIRVEGMAPGATLMALKIFSNYGGDEDAAVAAIQYAAAHGVNVINESFSYFRNPDFGLDPIEMANNAAIARGVFVVGITWDAGTAPGTMYPPGTGPNVLTVGASTQLQSYRQIGAGGVNVIPGGYVSNNVSAISSSGVSDDGQKTVDVVAPGDLGWALCTADNLHFPDCTDNNNLPAPIQLFGGTSEAAPLAAGEAALVIQAYRKTHAGKTPAPALIRQIIMSTATDLGAPAAEQGAGLINALAAVNMAKSIGSATDASPALLTSPADLKATVLPGKSATLKFTVTNESAGGELVTPKVMALGAPFSTSAHALTIKAQGSPTFVDEYGQTARYVTRHFTVPAGANRLDAAIAWNVVRHPGDLLRLSVFDPSGNIVGYSLPQDSASTASGYAHIGVHDPTPGSWTALVWSDDVRAYDLQAQLTTAFSKFMPAGQVAPASQPIGTGKTATFTVTSHATAAAGDTEPEVMIPGAGSIPILLRTVVPVGNSGGSFSGMLTGGNGRSGRGDALVYTFSLPKGKRNVDISVKLAQSGYNIEGVLSGPNGAPVDVQSTVTHLNMSGTPDSFGNWLQFFRRTPAAGPWSLLIFVNNSIAGTSTSTRFAGNISFGPLKISQTSVPDSPHIGIAAGHIRRAKISITNTGHATESYFVDPRLAGFQNIVVSSGKATISEPWFNNFFVPALTTKIVSTATSKSPSIPVSAEITNVSGAPPNGYLYSPRVLGTRYKIAGVWRSKVLYQSAEAPSGFWGLFINTVGPFPGAGTATVVSASTTITTQRFDANAATSTGDFWIDVATGSSGYRPLVLARGKSGVVTVELRSSGAKGSVVHGTLYVETSPVSNHLVITDSSDELQAIPFAYTVK